MPDACASFEQALRVAETSPDFARARAAELVAAGALAQADARWLAELIDMIEAKHSDVRRGSSAGRREEAWLLEGVR